MPRHPQPKSKSQPRPFPQSCNNRVVHRSNYFLHYTDDTRDFRYQVGRAPTGQRSARCT